MAKTSYYWSFFLFVVISMIPVIAVPDIFQNTNYKGEWKQTQKQGFATKREEVVWERKFVQIEPEDVIVACL